MSAVIPASSSTWMSKSSGASCGRAIVSPASAPSARRRSPLGDGWARPVGSSSTSWSTTTPGSPTPRCSRTSGHDRRGLPTPGERLVQRAWDQARARAQRQRRVLPLPRSRRCLPRAGAQAQLHAPLPPSHQRQSRTLHPNTRQQLGIWARLAVYGGDTAFRDRHALIRASAPSTGAPRAYASATRLKGPEQ